MKPATKQEVLRRLQIGDDLIFYPLIDEWQTSGASSGYRNVDAKVARQLLKDGNVINTKIIYTDREEK